MSKKVDENYFPDEREEEEEDKKCPPKRVPSLNPNHEWAASHKPEERTSTTRFQDNPREPSMKLHVDKKEAEIYNHQEQQTMQSLARSSERHEGQRNVTPKHEAVAIEEAILFDEKEEMKGGTDGHVLASNVYQMSASPKDNNTAHDTFSGRHMVSASRGPDYSLGAESVDTQGWHCSQAAGNRRRWDQEFTASLPGAFREGYNDIEEGYAEDEFTVTAEEENEEQAPVVTREKSLKPVSADLVDEEEENRRLQEKINQALERERQHAVVAEVVPASDGDLKGTRRRHWFIVGAVLLLVVVAIATPLGVKLPGKSQEPFPYPDCEVSTSNQKAIGNGNCDDKYNTTECKWDGGDCLPYCDDGFFGPSCEITGYPNCNVPDNKWIGDGYCEYEYNTTECGWDGGDCLPCDDGYFGYDCTLHYPNCLVPHPEYIGDGTCMGEPYNTTECGWDGGDCLPSCDDGYYGYDCTLHYPNCLVSKQEWIEGQCGFGSDPVMYPCFTRSSDSVGDGLCDGEPFNTEECGWDGGDCCAPGLVGPKCDVTIYPNCNVSVPNYIGDGMCDGEPFNTEECGWDGGDCCVPGFVGPNCNITDYPNCTVPDSHFIGDGNCDGEPFNTEECGWDGGDCCTPGSGLVGPFCNNTSYPNCNVPIPNYIGDGECDYGDYNTEECGWDGGDCV